MHGKSTSGAEVTRIGAEGIRVRVQDREFFLDYGHFPWFRDALPC